MNSKFLQDNIIYFFIPIIVIGLGIYFSVTKITETFQKADVLEQKQQEQQTKKNKLNQLLAAKKKLEQIEEVKKEGKSGKVIYEVLGQQFSSEASFGIMFENI